MADAHDPIESIVERLFQSAAHPDHDDLGQVPVSNPELTILYVALKTRFRETLARAVRVSRGSGGISSTGNRLFWSSVLFTRIAVMAKSIDSLLPNPKPGEHWDFSSIASLTRNLYEAYLVYFWLCQDEIIEEAREARFILFYLHDYGSRRRMYPDTFSEADPVYQDLVQRFDRNHVLKAFSETQRRIALKGEKTLFVQDDVLSRMGVDHSTFRHMYRFFSQHTHTGPLSFYRMVDHDRGSGVETRHEKYYIIVALIFAQDVMQRAIEGHLQLFPDAETRKPFLTSREIILNVERAQGRAKPLR